MIRVEALGKSFDNKKVLSDIDITFEAGKVNLIIGKSGSGKTVLLKSLIGLHSVTTGHPSEISGGMKKRVAIARAIVLQPKFLFCDEPNSGLDPLTSIVIDNLISELTHEYNMTTVVNTHDMNSVFEIGEKIVFIHEGRKEWEGSKEQIAHTDNPYLNEFIFSSQLFKLIKKDL